MSKILVNVLPTQKVNGKTRQLCVVGCPDCKKRREIRYDAFHSAETTCCRSCTNLRRPTKPEEALFNWREYYHSKVGKLSHIFQDQRIRCKEKGWEPPQYTREALVEWGMARTEYHTLFDAWAASGFLRELSPSIDRLDDYKTYMFSNIRIVSWQENNDKGRHWQVIGKNTKNCLAVDQLDLKGNFIKRFHSAKAAARELSVDDSKIGQVCKALPVKKGSRMVTPQTAGGFKWRYSLQPNP